MSPATSHATPVPLGPERRLVCQLRDDGVIQFVNQDLAETLGSSVAALVGRAITGVPERAFFEDLVGHAATLTIQTPVHVGMGTITAHGGAIIRVRWTIFAWFDAERRLGFLAVGRDMEAEEQVLDAFELKRHVLANLQGGVHMVRASDGVFLYTNPAFERMLGYERGELLGRHVSVVNAPLEDMTPEQRAGEIIRALRDNGRWSGEICNRRKDGGAIWSQVWVTTVEHPTWGLVWLTEHIDISDRKHMADELSESQKRLQAIVDNTTAVIYMKTPDGRYLLVNRRFEEVFHLSKEDVEGRTDRELFPADIVEPLRLNDRAVFRARAALEFDEIVPHEDGDHTYISVKFPLMRSSGEVYAVCGISTDITARLRAQHALEESYAVLEQRVAERTAELSTINRRLQGEIADRRRAEARQELMTTELDHRVKNALATVVALADQTLDSSGSLDEFRGSFLGRLRTMARSHEALARGRWEGVDIAELVRLVLAPFEAMSRGGIQVEGVPARLASKAALPVCLALHELATNAVKHGCLSQPSGELRVEWRVVAVERLALEWSERGGPATFAPARRGMGLQLVQELIEGQLDGAVSMRFAAEGFSCTLEIPIAAGGSPERVVAAPSAARSSVSQGSLSGLCVLVVEDDRLQANMLSRWFTRLGCRVLGPVKSSDEAMRMIRDQRIDAAVLDVNLDGHSSESIADTLLAQGKVVVFLTGNADFSRLSPRFAGVPTLSKPVELPDLEQVMKRALNASQ